MRIISGTLKGRIIQAPSNLPVRPTTDFARTGLFNILNSRIDFEDISFLDLFSGTGAISLEMASRGCNDIISVDSNRECVRFLQQTINSWKVPGIKIIKEDAFSFMESTRIKSDLIFADPPYALRQLKDIPALVIKNNLVKPEGLFILEHGDEHSFKDSPHFEEVRNYGNVNFSIFQF
jgi:16S rRNA (guanine966-N2)-methyltransferase